MSQILSGSLVRYFGYDFLKFYEELFEGTTAMAASEHLSNNVNGSLPWMKLFETF